MTGAALADLLASLVAIGRSMQEEFDPQRFLDQFSDQLQRLIPHDRLVIDLLDEECRTFTVFAEHASPALRLHQDFYTTAFDPEARYVVGDWVMRPVFSGEAMRVDDLTADPRFATVNPFERRVQEAGLRSGLLVPLSSGGRVVGALVAPSLPAHASTARREGPEVPSEGGCRVPRGPGDLPSPCDRAQHHQRGERHIALPGGGAALHRRGALLRDPHPRAPLKATSAIAIALAVRPEAISAAAFWMGVLFVYVSLFKLNGLFGKIFPRPIVRGIQLGLGILLVKGGLSALFGSTVGPIPPRRPGPRPRRRPA